MIRLAELKAALEITDNASDVALLALIERATAVLGRELGRYLGPPAQRVEVKTPPGYGQPLLLFHDITPDTDLKVEQRTTAFEPWVELPALDANLKPNYVVQGREIMARSGWNCGWRTVQITYVAGYDTGAGPAEFQALILQACTDFWNGQQAASAAAGGIKSETIGDYSYTNFTAAELASASEALGRGWAAYVRAWRRLLV